MYAISDTEVTIKRNVPRNALQNKNQHCTVLQLKGKKGKGGFIFASSCLYRSTETEYLSYGILSTQHLTGYRNGDESRINPSCTKFTAQKNDICEKHIFEHIHCSIYQNSAVEVEISSPHMHTYTLRTIQSSCLRHLTDGCPRSRARQNNLSPVSSFRSLFEILCPGLQSSIALYYSPGVDP